MALTLGDAILYLRGDQGQLDQDLKKAKRDTEGWAGQVSKAIGVQLDKGFTGLQNLTKTGLKVGLGALTAGFVALGVGIKGAVSLGSDAEEMMGKFSVVFGKNADGVSDALDDMAMAMGRSKFEMRGMASTLGDTFKPMGFTLDEASDLSVQLSALAVDLGSFNNMETDEALRRLQGTLIGSHENALAFGVIINENTLKAEMAANGWDTLTGMQLEQAKVQARINLLMKGTTDAQGDAERTGASWANTTRRLTSMLKDAGTEIGMKLLPIVTPLLQRFTDMAATALPVVIERIGAGIQVAGTVLGTFVDMLAKGESPLRALEVALFDTFDGAAWLDGLDLAIQWLTAFKDAAMGILQPVLDFIANNVQLSDVLMALGVVAASIVIPALLSMAAAVAPVIAVAALLIGGIALLRKGWESDFLGMRTILTNFWEGKVKPAFGQLQEWTKEKLPRALNTLRRFWEEKLLPAIKSVWSFIDANLIPLFAALVDIWLAGVELKLAVLAAVWDNVLKPALTGMWQFVKANIIPIFDGMSGSIGGVTEAIKAVIGWIGTMATKLREAADKIPSLFRPGSPTPFELGFRGIADAIDEVQRKSLRLNVGSGGLMSAGAAAGVVTNNHFAVNVTGVTGNPVSVAHASRDGVLNAARRIGL